MSNDAYLIRKMLEAWNEGAEISDSLARHLSPHMACVLAVVRAHDAKPAQRVPVQIVVESAERLWVLANDGTVHLSQEGEYVLQLPPLPQPGNDA